MGTECKRRNTYISLYEKYMDDHKGIGESRLLFDASVPVLVGYFLKVHSKKPMCQVRRCIINNEITFVKGRQVLTLLEALS